MRNPIAKKAFPILVVFGLFAVQAEAAVYTLNPIEDTYVDFYNGNTNFGNIPGLNTSIAFLSPRAFSYLKFDFSAIPANEIIIGATLNMFQQGVAGVGDVGGPVDVSHYTDSWSESTVTWNNAPPIPGPRLATNNVQTTGWVNWNLFDTGLWDPAADLDNDLLSLVLGEGSSADSAHGFCSRESDPILDNCLVAGETDFINDRDPYLTLQTTVIPIPATVWLFASGLLGLIGISRRKKAA